MNYRTKEDINDEIVKRLKPLNPLKIILFGSYAYGTPTENSDIDICIVKENVKSKIKEKRKARRLLKDITLAKDILIPSKSEYDFYKNEYGSVYMDIDKKGKLLWPNT
jgi:predicted nucleotidyltransferase